MFARQLDGCSLIESPRSEHASAPVGTTVKVTNFFEHFPVRKETTLKQSAKLLANIKRLLQAYAFVRPFVRFSFRVLNARSKTNDFVYAPKKDANIEDAVLKIIGKHCVQQHGWANTEVDGFEFCAFLPKPNALGTKILSNGAFISVDGRPVSNSRGTPRKIAILFKEYIRKANCNFSSVKDHFFYLNIKCPTGSYDPNIEPAKDDVLFDNEDHVVSSVSKLLDSFYSRTPPFGDEDKAGEAPVSSPSEKSRQDQTPDLRTKPIFTDSEDDITETRVDPAIEPLKAQPIWYSDMYSMDDADLDFNIPEVEPSIIIEEDEAREAAEALDPWTIARMNASMRGNHATYNKQLVTPIKNSNDVTGSSSSPVVATQISNPQVVEPLTPNTCSGSNIRQYFSAAKSHDRSQQQSTTSASAHREIFLESQISGDLPRAHSSSKALEINSDQVPLACVQVPSVQSNAKPQSSPDSRCDQRIQPTLRGDRCTGNRQVNNNELVDQPLGGRVSKPSSIRKQKRATPRDNSTSNRAGSGRIMDQEDQFAADGKLFSENNADIRDFLKRSRAPLRKSIPVQPMSRGPSSAPFGRPSKRDREAPLYPNPSIPKPTFMQRASSLEPPQQPQYVQDRNIRPHKSSTAISIANDQGPRPRTSQSNIAAMFAAYEEREALAHNTAVYSTHATPSFPITVMQKFSKEDQTNHRQNIDCAQRSRSSRLPLERVTQGYRIQGVIFTMSITIGEISNAMKKLDRAENSLEWGSSADQILQDTFGLPIKNGLLKLWAVRIDVALCRRYEPENDIDCVSSLEQSLHIAFDANTQRVANTLPKTASSADASATIQLDTANSLDRVKQWAMNVEPSNNGGSPSPNLNVEPTFDGSGKRAVCDVEDNFDDGIDNEMLLDF